ncbi:MAG: peptidoglycan recognition family protein [Chloroflexota bacterium]
MTGSLRWSLVSVLCVVNLFVFGSLPVHAASTGARASSAYLQTSFSAAAREFKVPDAVLKSVSYNESRWDDHAGLPSTSGGYGPMGLTHVDRLSSDRRGYGSRRDVRRDPALHTLDVAATLVHQSASVLERDPAQNIRGGAALLARYARETTGALPSSPSRWYGAVALYSGSRDAHAALNFAQAVFATIRTGVARTTVNGQRVSLSSTHVTTDARTLRTLHLQEAPPSKVECPRTLGCRFVPAAYAINDATDPTNYGNYDVAHRNKDGLTIRYIVIHDTESSYAGAIQGFQNPSRYASSNYVIRSSDGAVTQMVPNEDVAWHAGNYYVNMHAIGIEHEGVAIQGATWYSEQLYQASASLVRYLSRRYKIPLDRAHIIGHDEVPGPTPATQTSQHWDPGPFWDWSHYMDLLQAPIQGSGDASQQTGIITINPTFSANQPAVTYCFTAGDCRPVTGQPANFVYLYTAPNLDAPLLGDRALHGAGTAGTTRADDWGDKAVTGQQFYRVDQQGDWSAIDYGGTRAWFYDANGSTVTLAGTGIVITPKAGRSSVPVYGRAYPAQKSYPVWVPRKQIEKVVPLQYSIPSGQMYVAAGDMTADFYWSPTQKKRALIVGKARYYQIYFNHRFAFVKAGDVDVVPPTQPTPGPG